ncbi:MULTISPECIES: hypothetical protein [Flavobacterium]|uniref:Uncharacterized protein n=2 Tax=Flavobacterium TaxID=237 RepID=A0ABP7UPI7_9FLAO
MTKRIKILFFLFLICNSAFSHKNTFFKKNFGNIELVCSTYYYTEEMNKNLIVGQYAQKLSELLNYNQSILIFLNQDETISFRAWRKDSSSKDESADLNIFIDSPDKDVSRCLSYIEKVILNRDRLKKEKFTLQNWYYTNDVSLIVQEVLRTKINRPNDIEQLPKTKFFDYYFQNNRFHVISNQNCGINDLGTFDDIIQFVEPKYYTLCMFTTKNILKIFETSCDYNFKDNKYYFNSKSTELKIEKRKDFFTSFRPYKITSLGKTNIVIESMWGEDVYLYCLSRKIFIEDLEKQIEK